MKDGRTGKRRPKPKAKAESQSRKPKEEVLRRGEFVYFYFGLTSG